MIIVIRTVISLFFLSFFIATYSYCWPISAITKVAEITKFVDAVNVTAEAGKVIRATSITATVINNTSKVADFEGHLGSKSMSLNDYCQHYPEDMRIYKTKVMSIYLKPNKAFIRGISKLRYAVYKLPEIENY